METPVFLLLIGLLLGGISVVDRWALKNYVSSESARAWCKAQFLFSSDPRPAVAVSSTITMIVAVALVLAAAAEVVNRLGR